MATGKANDPLVHDPDMTFELAHGPDGVTSTLWLPVALQLCTGHYTEAVFRSDDGRVLVRPAALRDLRSFAAMWGRNLLAQGYLDRFRAGRGR